MGEYHYVSSVPLDQWPDNLNKKTPTLAVTKRPVQSQNMLPISSVLDPFSLLNNRFNKIGFQPLDVGGLGDCFFRAISHQLYGDPNGHVYIRMSGVEYMKDNPERFIESNTENCWMEYLSNMAKQGTWADALIIQGCLEISDLKKSDPRPEKLRPSGVSKTQTSQKFRPTGVSKTQTQKTQTLGCLENSDPKNSDPLGVSKTQTRKIKHIYTT